MHTHTHTQIPSKHQFGGECDFLSFRARSEFIRAQKVRLWHRKSMNANFVIIRCDRKLELIDKLISIWAQEITIMHAYR